MADEFRETLGVLKLRDRSLDSSFHQQAVVILNLNNILKTNQFPGGDYFGQFFLGVCRCSLRISALCRVFFGQLQTPAILVTFGHTVATF